LKAADQIASTVGALQAARGRRTLLLAASSLDLELLPELYSSLEQVGRGELDVVLYGRGGEINAARRIALLLRKYATKLCFIVPHHCQSSYTALALSGDKIVGGDLAMFSPIDPRLNASQSTDEDSPSALASEDIRVFREMGEDWFGVDKQGCVQLLEYLAASIFPTTLTSLYRSTREVKSIGEELIGFQLPQTSIEDRAAIVDQLLFGYHSHSFSLTINDLHQLGLNVSRDAEAEALAWKIAQQLPQIVGGGARQSPQESRTDVLIGSVDELRVRQWVPGAMGPVWTSLVHST